ncbi:MAG TPA: N-acetylmannosamine-6-phosphate 2-epimerase [Acholeplasmataceae bacterium]|nr:N-acetylmannosamine-6-phosphate 2-epimerase [Acholeplasmataceae bacterium]
MLDKIYHQLIVSCQARPGEPLRDAAIMAKMAQAAVLGGAAAIRAAGVEDILAIKAAVSVPVIGLIKRNYPDSEVYITPTEREVEELVATGCEMIAIDATARVRSNGTKLENLIALIHHHRRLALADVATFTEAKAAQDLGFDAVATTMAGYTSYTRLLPGPDFRLLRKMVRRLFVPVIAEGRIYDARDLRKVLRIGPHAVVIGTAITRPHAITERFVRLMQADKYQKTPGTRE